MLHLESDGTVTVHGIRVGQLVFDKTGRLDPVKSEPCISLLLNVTDGNDPIALSQELRDKLIFVDLVYDCCPDCGERNFRWWESAGADNEVDIGFCIECKVHVYRYASRIHRQWDDKCGHPEVVNYLRAPRTRPSAITIPAKAPAFAMD